ncbi:MAG: hypothetical protein KBD32_09690, partial [Burkholderiales bacterium]|nr:hypothetical protein [Burkholderiales bacterium]
MPMYLEDLNKNHLCVGNINFDLTTDREVYTLHKSGTVLLFPNHGRLFTNNTLHNRQIALSGQAIAGGWDDFFAAELKSGQLCRVLPDYSFGEITFYLIRLKNHEKSAITTFIKFLDDCIERAKSQLS